MKTNSNNLISLWRNHQFCILLCVFAICSLIFDISNHFRGIRQNPFMQNEPNFKTSRQPVTLDMLRTYNDNQPEKRRIKRTQNEQKMNKKRKKTKKNEPKRTKTSQIPPQKTPTKPNSTNPSSASL